MATSQEQIDQIKALLDTLETAHEDHAAKRVATNAAKDFVQSTTVTEQALIDQATAHFDQAVTAAKSSEAAAEADEAAAESSEKAAFQAVLDAVNAFETPPA